MSKKRIAFETCFALLAIALAAVALISVGVVAASGGEERSIVVPLEAEAVPHVLTFDEQVLIRLDELESRLRGQGIFRKPAPPDSPGENAPKVPNEPPQFEFPDSPETDADPTAIKDWSPEQWKSFFDTIMYLITAIVGLFGGGMASGVFKKKAAL